MATADGRSPIRPRQLHDLRLLPTADDPRPTFFWSADPPRDVDITKTTPYPRLLWHVASGEEIVVFDLSEHQAKQAEGCWTETAPSVVVLDPIAALQAELDALSPEDRTLVLEAQRQQRLGALQAKLAAVSPSALESLTTGTATEKPRRGRPPKSAA